MRKKKEFTMLNKHLIKYLIRVESGTIAIENRLYGSKADEMTVIKAKIFHLPNQTKKKYQNTKIGLK